MPRAPTGNPSGSVVSKTIRRLRRRETNWKDAVLRVFYIDAEAEFDQRHVILVILVGWFIVLILWMNVNLFDPPDRFRLFVAFSVSHAYFDEKVLQQIRPKLLVVGHPDVDDGVVDENAVGRRQNPPRVDHARSAIALQMYGPQLCLPRPSAARRFRAADDIRENGG